MPTTSIVGIVQAQDAISDYYILGYYTTNPAKRWPVPDASRSR